MGPGVADGATLGCRVGESVGTAVVGCCVIVNDGLDVGIDEGATVGCFDGRAVGWTLGCFDGSAEGSALGSVDG